MQYSAEVDGVCDRLASVGTGEAHAVRAHTSGHGPDVGDRESNVIELQTFAVEASSEQRRISE
jgi:hypothetical protein